MHCNRILCLWYYIKRSKRRERRLVIVQYILLGVIAFVCETIDSSLGGGYGTILIPVLFLMGYEPLEVVPLILVSEMFTGLAAGFFHHVVGNVDLKPGSKPFKIGVILGLCAVAGSFVAVFFAFTLPKNVVKGYIAFLIISLGLLNLLSLRTTFPFSWHKIIGLGFLASFNKGLSGGGYGPLIVGGQILSGLSPRNAVGITSFAEGLTCVVGIATYVAFNGGVLNLNWELGGALLTGAMLSVPLSVNLVKLIDECLMRSLIAWTITALGLAAFCQTFGHLLVFENTPLVVLAVLLALPLGFTAGKSLSVKKREGCVPVRNEDGESLSESGITRCR